MEALGNPNQPISLDVEKLFKTAGPLNPSPPHQQQQPPISSSPLFFHPQNQQLYMPPSTSATAPQDFSNFAQDGKSVSYASALMNPNNAGNQILALINSPPQNLEFPPQHQHQPHQLLPPQEFMGPAAANLNSVTAPSIGRRLAGNYVIYDVDVRIPGELQPRLDVNPITKYGSDPQLVLGRQIGVNKSYICYGLKGGNIRILNINTALRSLLRGHTQRVTDMAFFAEDVHLLASVSLEGTVCVWKITEGPDEDDNPEISGKIVIAVQIVDGQYVHPRVCWHRHKQEILVVAIGKCVLRIDMTKVGKNAGCSSDMSPLQCSIDKLIDGIQLVGKHDGDVTDLSMCQWMTTRLVSASTDGTIKIWEDRKAVPLAVLRPHDGQPVYSAAFLTAPHRPDHIILVTGGPLNREIKIWTSGSEEGWPLPSNTESWTCTQTLDLKSSAKSQVEDAFFNQVAAVSEAGLVIVANAKRNAIYAVHLVYGSCPAATRMDYISEFTVTMPILSLIGTIGPPDEHIVKVYCVQTHAIQQYALELCQCIPPPLETLGLEKSNSSLSHVVEGFGAFDTDSSRIAPPPLPPSPRLTRKASGFQSPSPKSRFEPASQFSDHVHNHDTNHSINKQMGQTNLPDVSSLDDGSRSNEKKIASDDMSSPRNPPFIFKHPTHLVTPSEILMAASSIESNNQDLVDNSDVTKGEVEVKVVGEARSQYGDIVSKGESQELSTANAERLFGSQASDLGIQMARESGRLSGQSYHADKSRRAGDVMSEPLAQPHSNEEGIHDSSSDATRKQSPAPTPKGKKHKGKLFDASLPVDSSNEPGVNSDMQSSQTVFPQILAMQETLNQLVSMQKEVQKQLSGIVNLPVTKEGRRLEAALGRSIEKALKANNDTQWACYQEEITNYEKSSRDQMQEITSFFTNHVNKDLAVMLEKAVKKELAPVGQNVARTITPSIEKTIASAVAESFQRGVGDKAVNQIEKSVNSKLETTVARQIQAQFQTSGRQTLQDTLKSSIEVSVIPAFEMSCKAMFQNVDTSFQKALMEHRNSANLNIEAAHSSLAHALRDSMNSASAIARTLSGDFADNQLKLMALVAAGANSNAGSPLASQISNGSLSEKVDILVDPKSDLSRLISQRKYEEAFSFALQRSDLSIVSWLCLKVDLRAILAIAPLPLSQGVLISLLQQLACDVNNDTSRKLGWMTDVAAAINPTDQMIAMHVRPIFEQVYKILHQLHTSPAITGADHSSIRLLMHVIHSVLMTCK